MGELIFIVVVVLIMKMIKVPAKQSHDEWRNFPEGHPYREILRRQEQDQKRRRLF